MSETVRQRIVGVTLLGDTWYRQSNGTIEGYPPDRLQIYCNLPQDLMCQGFSIVTAYHLSPYYIEHALEAAQFLKRRVESF